MVENAIKTISVIASCIVFSCTRLNGPPSPLKPIRFAGTWNKYSKKAIPQLMRMIEKRPRFWLHDISLNFRWPYHAQVINILEMTKKITVVSPFIVSISNVIKPGQKLPL